MVRKGKGGKIDEGKELFRKKREYGKRGEEVKR